MSEEDLYFPRKTILAEVDWNLASTKDGQLVLSRIQRFTYDGAFWCEVTVGKVPHRSRLLHDEGLPPYLETIMSICIFTLLNFVLDCDHTLQNCAFVEIMILLWLHCSEVFQHKFTSLILCV